MKKISMFFLCAFLGYTAQCQKDKDDEPGQFNGKEFVWGIGGGVAIYHTTAVPCGEMFVQKYFNKKYVASVSMIGRKDDLSVLQIQVGYRIGNGRIPSLVPLIGYNFRLAPPEPSVESVLKKDGTIIPRKWSYMSYGLELSVKEEIGMLYIRGGLNDRYVFCTMGLAFIFLKK